MEREDYFKMKHEQLTAKLANALIDIAILAVQQQEGVVTQELVNKQVGEYLTRPIDEIFPDVRVKVQEDETTD